jgi:hypothetical protein
MRLEPVAPSIEIHDAQCADLRVVEGVDVDANHRVAVRTIAARQAQNDAMPADEARQLAAAEPVFEAREAEPRRKRLGSPVEPRYSSD